MVYDKKQHRILIIEDERVLLSALKEILDHNVYTALDGEEGLRIANKVEPHLILLDVTLPKKDGFQFLQEYTGNAKILVLTNQEVSDVSEKIGKHKNVVDVIGKTNISARELREYISYKAL